MNSVMCIYSKLIQRDQLRVQGSQICEKLPNHLWILQLKLRTLSKAHIVTLHLRDLGVDFGIHFSNEFKLRFVENNRRLLLTLLLIFLTLLRLLLLLLLRLLSGIIDVEYKYVTFQLLPRIFLQCFD